MQDWFSISYSLMSIKIFKIDLYVKNKWINFLYINCCSSQKLFFIPWGQTHSTCVRWNSTMCNIQDIEHYSYNKYICVSQPVSYITYRVLIAIHRLFFFFVTRNSVRHAKHAPVRLCKTQWPMSTYFWLHLRPSDYANIQS